MRLSELQTFVESRWPSSGKADWDNPGLAVGDWGQQVRKCLLAVDVTPQVLQEAINSGCQLVFSHHPMLLRGIDSVTNDRVKGHLVTTAIKHSIAIFSAHTNADFVVDGVTETLAKTLGISPVGPLAGVNGVIGTIPTTTLIEAARTFARRIPSAAQGILVQGDPGREVSKIGLIAGAGDSYLPAAAAAGVDLFITSDLRHHPASDFRDQGEVSGGPALMSISHFSAEWPWLNQAAQELRTAFPAVEFVVSELNTDPWDFAVMQ
jgi:dinuclear metal center YbgI/SA1388 family protein